MKTTPAHCLTYLLISIGTSNAQNQQDAPLQPRPWTAGDAPEPSRDTSTKSWPESSLASPDERAQRPREFLPVGYPEPFGASLTQSWFEAWPHSHFSRRGTPFVHLFGLEPAFMDRDLFLDYRSAKGFGEDEVELGAELELALTRRIGLVLELPYTQLDPEGEASAAGVGDFAIAPRLLLVDTEAFLLSMNMEVTIPSGNASKGLGNGELALAPSLSAWVDLGHWIQVSLQAGSEHLLESGDAEIFYNGALAYSFLTPQLFGPAWHDHDHSYAHFPAGLTNVILELSGRTVLDGLDDGRSTAELLFGLSYNINGSWAARAGYQIPVGGDEDIRRALVLSLVRHF